MQKAFQFSRLTQQCWSAGLDLLFPPCCQLCDQLIDSSAQEVLLCAECIEELLTSACAYCSTCGMSFPEKIASPEYCPYCRKEKFRFNRVVRLGVYENELRKAILHTKQATAEPLTVALAELLWKTQQQNFLSQQYDMIIPVPMHWSRRWIRGVNSPEIISERLSKHLKIPWKKLLVRSRSTQPQGSLTRAKRQENIKNAFRLRAFSRLQEKRVLLVDDILTSGATCQEASLVLKKAKVASISVAVIARTETPI